MMHADPDVLNGYIPNQLTQCWVLSVPTLLTPVHEPIMAAFPMVKALPRTPAHNQFLEKFEAFY